MSRLIRTQAEWIDEYQKRDAYWQHDGNPLRPHALLTSGKHSNGFFNSRLVIPSDTSPEIDRALFWDAARDLLIKVKSQHGPLTNINMVVGPQTGATLLAKYMAAEINHKVACPCFSASPEKKEEEGSKFMRFTEEERGLVAGKTVLLCEDVITTGLSVELTAKAVKDAGGTVLPFVVALVNRSGHRQMDGRSIHALINVPMPIWHPSECPLCRQASDAVRPKDNWTLLNAS